MWLNSVIFFIRRFLFIKCVLLLKVKLGELYILFHLNQIKIKPTLHFFTTILLSFLSYTENNQLKTFNTNIKYICKYLKYLLIIVIINFLTWPVAISNTIFNKRLISSVCRYTLYICVMFFYGMSLSFCLVCSET